MDGSNVDRGKPDPMTATDADKQGGPKGKRAGGQKAAKGDGSGAQAPKPQKQKLQQQLKDLRGQLREAEAKLNEQSFPLAGPAVMHRRHWGLIASFVALVLLPVAAVIFYLIAVAQDQYQSTTGFTVRSQESSGAANDLLGGLASFTGSSVASDSDILFEFIQSQEMIQVVDRQIDLRAHYSQHWPSDWAFSLWPDASQEELIWYWQRIVGPSTLLPLTLTHRTCRRSQTS